MLTKCANPLCRVVFRYLEDGRLFRIESDPPRAAERRGPEYFWLCRYCSASMTLRLDETTGVRVIPFQDSDPAEADSLGFELVDKGRGSLLKRIRFFRQGARRRPDLSLGGRRYDR